MPRWGKAPNIDFNEKVYIFRIKNFMNALYTGFRMLNLKNDNLRFLLYFDLLRVLMFRRVASL